MLSIMEKLDDICANNPTTTKWTLEDPFVQDWTIEAPLSEDSITKEKQKSCSNERAKV